MPTKTIREAINDALRLEMRRDRKRGHDRKNWR